ncbi:unnamed protein product [Lactuca virosa]|uniref:Uncharacterized protein n=1 Tax=Lactuca virosa TaxID=75947 RepID=A0AAU9NJB8_9ASTR|nr:unnamed protein product [Lactuca virosa]
MSFGFFWLENGVGASRIIGLATLNAMGCGVVGLAICGTFCFSNPLAIQHPPIDMSSNQNASASIGYEFLLLEHVALQDPPNVSVAILHQFDILPEICFRGHKSRQYLKELKRGIFTLQSYVRGEKTRKEFGVLLQRHRAAVVIQKQIKSKGNESDEVVVKSSYLAELQRRILKAEAGLREKEEENDILHQRLQQYESRW